ncbi:hypothetical protein [Tessaracoccus caeni]|uniref:hypothetical protein n=1 Tax=Tessaracoccus caeni TaxID=3031239 RepID=UPI0023D9F5AC|nr:hypothetical protein [Tessaracoccus caeni]MDF1488747.1 hypothetical protein [Tessaracoccus caeni]
MIDWNASRLRRHWPPVTGIRVALLLCLIAAAALELSAPDEPTTRAPLGSLDYVLDGVGFVFVLAQFAAVFLLPATGALFAAVTAVALAALPGAAAYPSLWAAIAAVALGVWGWLSVAQLRAAPAARHAVPTAEVPFAKTEAYRGLWPGLVAISAALLAGVGLVVFHSYEMADVAAFEERAQVVDTEVLAVDEEDLYVSVSVNGITHELEWLDEMPEPGDTVALLVDPTDPERVVFADAPEDPSWLLGIAALSPLAAWYAALHWLFPALNRRRLARQGGPMGRARIATPSEYTYLIPTDATWPAMRLSGITAMEADSSGWFDASEDDDDWDDDEDDEDNDEKLPDSVEELRAYLDDLTADDPDEAAEPDESDLITVSTLGIPRRGATIAFHHRGVTWMAEVTDDTGTRGLRSDLRDLATPDASQSWLSRFIERHPQLSRVLWSMLIVVVTSAIVAISVIDDPTDWGTPLIVGLIGTVVVVVYAPGIGNMALRRALIVLYGVLKDERTPASRVSFMAANDDVVGLRLTDPDEVFFFAPEDVFHHEDATSEQALRLMRTWHAEAPSARGGTRLGAPAWAGIVLLAITATAVINAVLG